jgi:phenylacetate-CoA ligase
MREAAVEWIGRLAGWDSTPIYQRMQDAQFRTPPEQRERQRSRCCALVEHFRRNPFYARWAGEQLSCGPLSRLEDLSRLPVMTKQVITENFEEIFRDAETYSLDSTSGSTGRNFRFYHTRLARLAQTAAVRLGYAFIDRNYYQDSKCFLWGVSPGSWRAQVRQSVQGCLLHSRTLAAYGMDDARALAYLEQLRSQKPAVLVAYPSYLVRLARVGAAMGVPPPDLGAIVVSGEQLFAEHRQGIQDYFGVPVHARYGSREFGCIAHECSAGRRMHIIPDRFIIERSPQGSLLVTDLDNFATPFIRYDIGDGGRVEWSPCACGRDLPTLTEIQGRFNDCLRTRSGKILPGQFWTTISRKVGGIKEFQVVQHDLEQIQVRVVSDGAFSRESADALATAVRTLVGQELRIVVTAVERIEPTASGKRRFIISDIQEEDGHA